MIPLLREGSKGVRDYDVLNSGQERRGKSRKTVEKLTRRTKVSPEAARLSRHLFLAAAKIAVLRA